MRDVLAAVVDLDRHVADHHVPLLLEVEPGGAQLELVGAAEDDVALQLPLVGLAVEARLPALDVEDPPLAVPEGDGDAVEVERPLAVRLDALPLMWKTGRAPSVKV